MWFSKVGGKPERKLATRRMLLVIKCRKVGLVRQISHSSSLKQEAFFARGTPHMLAKVVEYLLAYLA
jgi:hypothetical protein